MKILYLTPSHIDYLSDQIYTGLCQNLGWQSVIDYPYKELYHNPDLKIFSLPQNPGQRCKLEEIVSLLNRHEFDFVVLSAIRREPLEALETLTNRCILPPLILLDGDDGTDIKTDLFQRYGFALYFKREYLSHDGFSPKSLHASWRVFGWGRNISDRTYPLPFSINLEGVPSFEDQRQEIDISFVGIASHRKRIQAVNMLREASDIRFEGSVYAEAKTRKSKLVLGTVAICKAKLQGDPYATEMEQRGKLSYEDYFRLIVRSKIGLSIRGAGFDTIRYWEIVAARRLLVSDLPYIHIPNNFEHGKHALFCRPDLSDLLDIVRTYLQDKNTRDAIAHQGHQHLLLYHTCEHRAKQFLDVCQKRL